LDEESHQAQQLTKTTGRACSWPRAFPTQEYPAGEDKPPKSEIVKGALKLEKGFLLVPDAPGISVELADDAKERYPFKPRPLKTRLGLDGAVVDQ